MPAGIAVSASNFAWAQAQGQNLTIGGRGAPDSMDPQFTATGTHAEALKHIFDTLVWSGDRLQLEPCLAESWSRPNPTTWEFKLRRGVKFHDGSEMTAEDVKFSIERMKTISGPTPATIYVRRVDAVTIVDPYTVRVTTIGPSPTLPNDFIRGFIVSHRAAAGLMPQNANRLVNLLRQYCDEVIAVIPLECASAATMITLGANEIQMGPMAYLTPVDTSLTHSLSPIDRDNDRVSLSLVMN